MNSGIKFLLLLVVKYKVQPPEVFFLKNYFHKYYKQSSFFVISNIENTGCKDVNHFSPEQPIYKKYKQEVLLV